MTHDDRIEAIAKAIYFNSHNIMHDHDKHWHTLASKSPFLSDARAALAAAGIEEIVRSGIDAYRDMLSDALSTDLENGVQWLNQRAAGTFSCDYPELCKALEMDAEKIVREVMGK